MPRSNKNWDDLGEWGASKAKKMVKEAKTKAALAFLESVTTPSDGNPYRTPVDTGNLMANTEVGLDKARRGYNFDKDTTGKNTYFEGLYRINIAEPWDKIYFTNSTEYNLEAEYEGWKNVEAYQYWWASYNNMLESIGVD